MLEPPDEEAGETRGEAPPRATHDRLTLTTMTYALLGLWPDSKKLGSKLFRQLLKEPDADTRARATSTTLNIMLRVLSGGAGKTTPVDVQDAVRLTGNLLNVDGGALRRALSLE